MSENVIQLPVEQLSLSERREDLLRDKDKWTKWHRKMADEAHEAREQLKRIEELQRELERDEIKALRKDEADSASS